MTADVPYADVTAAPIHYDLDVEALAGYRPAFVEPADFDRFWRDALEHAPTGVDVVRRPVDAGLSLVDTYDVTLAGYDGQPVRAWLVLPRERTGPLPCVVQYVGYGGGRGHVLDHLLWANAGYGHLVLDARGQGGDTPDSGEGVPVVARGLRCREEYYYRRVFVDAVQAVRAVRTLPEIDPARVVLAGASQGGGIALAAAALTGDVSAVLCDIPFLCHWERAVRLADRGPYADLARYCAQHRLPAAEVFDTLRYFDGLAFAARCRAPGLFSVALMDRVCPPSTVYAAYHRYAGPKRMVVWDFNDHEGGGTHQAARQLAFLRDLWGTG